MKKINLILCAAIISAIMCGCGPKNQYTISGTVDSPDMNGKQVYMFNLYSQNEAPVDSAVIIDGKYTFRNTVDEPWMAMAGIPDGFIFMLVVEPGNIVIQGDSVTGTPLNVKLREFYRKQFAIQLENEKNSMEYMAQYENATDDEARAQAVHMIDSLEAQNTANMVEANWKLYNENNDNILGVKAMLDIIDFSNYTYAEADSLLKTASPRVANDKSVLDKLEHLRILDMTSVGKHYTDLQCDNGKLSDLIDGKFAIIDFYASWCIPCRNEIKNYLVPLWENYKDKGVVVVGLNISEQGDAATRKLTHEKTVSELGMTYPQLTDSTSNAARTYGVKYIPQIILIAPDGTILARDLYGTNIENTLTNAMENTR